MASTPPSGSMRSFFVIFSLRFLHATGRMANLGSDLSRAVKWSELNEIGSAPNNHPHTTGKAACKVSE